jgi:SNF2 family DNA or RNA helicase
MGEGKNLTAAGYVIFADLFWTPANHQQSEERAYGRLGDMHGCTSYYCVIKDTIEDWIQELLARKLRVIEQTVEGIDTERHSSIANELLLRMKQEMRKLK